ncbi:MAG: MraY family glycosyltransferase [Parcubacteria group bacterium]|jgi:UDP-GlcNAc:undecaprenyl-phosphate GlcNAc-1-phosphate transferase
MKYLIPFLISLTLTVISIYGIILFTKEIKWLGRVGLRHIHKNNISRLGGLVMIVIFDFSILVNRDLFITPQLYGFLISNIILLSVYFWDDLGEIRWKIQLFGQIAVSVFVFIMGVRIYYVTNPLNGGILRLDSSLGVVFSVTLVIFWLVLLMNAINWADGIDGLSGGITFITVATIFFLSFRSEVNQPPIAVMCAILMGTILGFLMFNFYPSKIIAGTTGAMFMGFSLGILAIFAGTKIATSLLALAIPIIDFFWVIGERIRNKKSIFIPDRNHLHYKLMELGWSQRKIVLGYWIITSIIACVALNTRAIGKGITLLLVLIIMITSILIINRKISKLDNAKN